MFSRVRALQVRLRGEHWLFPVTAVGGGVLYLVMAVTLAAAARVPVAEVFGDLFILATGTLAFAAFWGGAGILATMGYPRVLLFTTPAHALAYFGLVARALSGPVLTAEEAILAIVNVFAFLALGVLAGLLAEGAEKWATHRAERAARAERADM